MCVKGCCSRKMCSLVVYGRGSVYCDDVDDPAFSDKNDDVTL